MIKKLLIANRGEIAVRIIRTAQRMGIHTVAIYSEIDQSSLHHSLADEAYCIGHSSLSETYLHIPTIIKIAQSTHCDAIHPGYGFLSENPDFVAACVEAGIIFVGPEAHVMHVMGNKIEARNFVSSLQIPITKGISGQKENILKEVDNIGFPVLVKAAGGGGGKGMRIVYQKEQLSEALDAASREALNYFADGTVYVEKYLEEPRHIEFQILGDTHGNVVHLYERECSIQRRYQKIIEEAPSPTLTPVLREKMAAASVAIGKAIQYTGAGTIEYLVDKEMNFYFLEMNTRIQVEHPVTELTTGIDIVEEQLRIASGNMLSFVQHEILQQGHALECRIYAENPAENFQPSPGKLSLYHKPVGPFIRVDDAMAEPWEVSSFFDPMIAKLITHGETRQDARKYMISALQEYVIHGIKNNISYLNAILQDDNYITNQISTKYCNEHTAALLMKIEAEVADVTKTLPLSLALLLGSQDISQANQGVNIWNTIGYWRLFIQPELEMNNKTYTSRIDTLTKNSAIGLINGDMFNLHIDKIHDYQKIELHINTQPFSVFISHPESGKIIISYNTHVFEVKRKDILPPQSDFNTYVSTFGAAGSNITSPMPGKVIKVLVKPGDKVKKGDILLVVEAMKMENNILSPADAMVDQVTVEEGNLVKTNISLLHLSAID